MDERYASKSWVQMVDIVYGEVDKWHDRERITANEWRWAQVKLPAFFKRIRQLEDEANPTDLDKPAFWDKVDKWGRNQIEVFKHITTQRKHPNGIPEVTEDDVRRAENAGATGAIA